MERYRPAGRPVRLAGALAVGTLLALAATGCQAAPTVNTPPGLSATPAPSSAAEAAPTPAPTTDGSSGGATTPKPAAAPVVCTTGILSVTFGGGGGAAGTIYTSLRFTNKSSRPCVISGFPGVSYVTGDHGTQVGQAAEREGARGGPVTLAPGAVASATLAMIQVLNYPEAACRPTPIRGLRVYPPADTASVFVPMEGTGCAGNPGGAQLRISTVKAGPGES